jgi:Peptidase family M23
MGRTVVRLVCALLGASTCVGVAALPVRAATRTVPASAASLSPGTEFTAFSATVLTHPAPFTGTDGFVHIAYELVLTNVTPLTIRINTLQVRNARTGRVLLSLAGAALKANLNPVGGPEATDSQASSSAPNVRSSESAIVWLDVRVRKRADVPAVLDHRVVGTLIAPPPGAPRSLAGVVGRVATVRHNPIALGPPVSPGTWLASEGCCVDDTHHRRGLLSVNGVLQVPQRFAIDWFALDSRHRAWVGDPSRLTSYLSYGLPAIAAASATVVDVQDGLRENPDIPKPPPIPPIQDTVGNHVILKVSPGMFLLYGHLKPGSLRVRLGQRVRRGQVLGLIGSSGNSTTPHLHFQVMTTATFFPTDSPPFVFDRFDLLGQVTQRIWDDNIGLQPSGTLPFAPAARPSTRLLEMPLDRNVISFPPPADAAIRR